MKSISTKRLPLPAAVLLSFVQLAHAQTSQQIPLDLIAEGNEYRLGIQVGVNGAISKEYIFDTGSDGFNIDVGENANGGGPAWFPDMPAGRKKGTLYGDGTYGSWQVQTTLASVQFYDPATGTRVATYATPDGLPASAVTDWIETDGRMAKDGHEQGKHIASAGTTKYYQDLTWQHNLDNGIAPMEGRFYGIFGAGDFGDSVTGNLTKTGFIVEANGPVDVPGGCGKACLIMDLTPELRAQFTSTSPWINGGAGKFALSGANAARQFDALFDYTLDGGNTSSRLETLLDTGTTSIFLNSPELHVSSRQEGQLDMDHCDEDDPYNFCDAFPGHTLTVNGISPGSSSTSVVTGDDTLGDRSNVVTVGLNPYTKPGQVLYGISFFMHNAVMYDLENKSTAFTPFYVTNSPFSTGTTGFNVTSAMGNPDAIRIGARNLTGIGFAGVISGASALTVSAGTAAQLSAANTYTGATLIAKDSWLGLAGPGSIAASQFVRADGDLDISRATGGARIRSLTGSGKVLLGANTLELTHANDSFSGALTDGGLGGGVNGGLIVAGGRQTLTGASTYTGRTGISPGAVLDLRGSLFGSVLDAGGLIGNGRIGGSLIVSGWVAPGSGAGSYQTLSVAGDYMQSAGSAYLAQLNPLQPGNSSQIVVNGRAVLAPGAQLDLAAAASGELYTKGSRYTLLTTNHDVSGAYQLKGATLSAVLSVAPVYDAHHFYLDVVQLRALAQAASTPNQGAALSGVQSLALTNNLFKSVTNLKTDAQIRRAADLLSGDIYASAMSTFLEDSRVVRDAVTNRLRQADQGQASNGQTAKTQPNGLAWWGQFAGSWGHHYSDGDAATVSRTLSGFLLGADLPVDLPGEQGRIGVAGGYTQTSLQVRNNNASGSSDDAHAALYAGTQWGALGLRLGAAYTEHTLDTKRAIALPYFIDHATGNGNKAATSQVFGDVGYQFKFKASTLEPFAQAAYVRLHNNSVREQGGAASLSGNSGHHAVGYSTLGTRVATHFSPTSERLTMHGTLGWRHAYGNLQPQSLLSFNHGTTFGVEGVPIARNALVVDVGLDIQVTKNASFNLAYNGQIAKHAVDSGFKGGFIWRF